jgi:Zn-dependent protease
MTGLLLLAGLAAVLLVHEAGHAAAATALRLPWRPVLTRRGPGVVIGRADLVLSRYQVVVTAAGGPAANLAAAFAISAAHLGLSFGFVAFLSILFALLNLLPFPHSDGARMLRPGRALARAREAASQ